MIQRDHEQQQVDLQPQTRLKVSHNCRLLQWLDCNQWRLEEGCTRAHLMERLVANVRHPSLRKVGCASFHNLRARQRHFLRTTTHDMKMSGHKRGGSSRATCS